jgi:hypothetical protein
MKNKKEVVKWFNNELSNKEVEDLKQSEDLQTLEKIAYYASQLETPKVKTGNNHVAISKLFLYLMNSFTLKNIYNQEMLL